MEDWAFHLAMFIFLFSTTILMLNVLIGKTTISTFFCGTTPFLFYFIFYFNDLFANQFFSYSLHSSSLCQKKNTALINVAFAKGDDGWRLAWIEARLRYIESAENLSYHIPGFRQTFDCFPKLIYFTATAKDVSAYIKKYPKGRWQDDIESLIDEWVKPDKGRHGGQDGNDEEKDKDVRRTPDASTRVEHLPLNSYDSRTGASPSYPSLFNTAKTNPMINKSSYWLPNSGNQGGDNSVGVGVPGSFIGHQRRHDSSSSGGSEWGGSYISSRQRNPSITSLLHKPGDPGPSSSSQPTRPLAVVVPTLTVATEEREEDAEVLMDPEILSATVRSLDRRMISLSQQADRIEQALIALLSPRSDNSTVVGAGSPSSLS